MSIEYNEKALRLIWLAQIAAISIFDVFPILETLVDEHEFFAYLMTVAGVVAGVAHADLSDECEDFNAFRNATREALREWDSCGFQPFGEGGALIAWNSLVDFTNEYRDSEFPYFWCVGYWVVSNLKRASPSEEELKGANAITGFLKVAFTEWLHNELLLWLTFSADEPDILRSEQVRLMNKIAEDGTDIPNDLPSEEREHLVQQQREDTDRMNRRIHERSTHRQAKLLLTECLEERKQFAFFLRNFENESTERWIARQNPVLTLPGDDPRHLMTVIDLNRQDNRIEEHLRKRLPIVGIANPADFWHRSAIPKLEVPNEDWYQVMLMLAERARIIVILISHISTGLSTELTAMTELGRKDSTVIVVQEEVDWTVNFARGAAEVDLLELPDWDSMSTRLTEYGTVIRASDIESRIGPIIDGMLAL